MLRPVHVAVVVASLIAGAARADGGLPVPRDTFTIVAQIPAATRAGASNAAVYGAEAWIRNDRGEVGALGTISAAQSTALARQVLAPVVIVVGRFAADAAELAIDVYRLERRSDDTIVVSRSAFTPLHGNRWAAARKYLTAEEAAGDPNRVGRNPFARFQSAVPGDALFHGIDLAGAQTALGLAIAYFHAHAGALAQVQLHIDVTQTHSGGWLRRTYTTTEHVIAQTNWRIAAPAPAQPWSSEPSYCVVALPCPDPALVASAGATFDDWTGPSLPVANQEIASLVSNSRGWTVLGLGAITGLLAPAAGPLDVASGLAGGGSPLQLQGAPFAGSDSGTAAPSLAPGTPLAAVAAAPLQRRVFGTDGDRLAGVQSGYVSTVAEPAGFQRDRAGAEMLDAVRQYQRCRERGLAGVALRRCAAPVVAGGAAP
jgi:hypothetical protein